MVQDPRCSIQQDPEDICEGIYYGAEFNKKIKKCKIVSWGCTFPPFFTEGCDGEIICGESALEECRNVCELKP